MEPAFSGGQRRQMINTETNKQVAEPKYYKGSRTRRWGSSSLGVRRGQSRRETVVHGALRDDSLEGDTEFSSE